MGRGRLPCGVSWQYNKNGVLSTTHTEGRPDSDNPVHYEHRVADLPASGRFHVEPSSAGISIPLISARRPDQQWRLVVNLSFPAPSDDRVPPDGEDSAFAKLSPAMRKKLSSMKRAKLPFSSLEDLHGIVPQALEATRRCKRWNLVLNLPENDQKAVYRECKFSLSRLLQSLNPWGIAGFPELPASVLLPGQDKRCMSDALGVIRIATGSLACSLGFDLLEQSWPSEPVWEAGWRPLATPMEVIAALESAAEQLQELSKPTNAGDSSAPAKLQNVAQEALVIDTRTQKPATPDRIPVFLTRWRDILIALGMRYNTEDKQKVSRLNKSYAGPILLGTKGKQPAVSKEKLLDWYRKLEIQFQDQSNQAKGRIADAESQHNWGKTGTAAPSIGGGVKTRRRDRIP